jgi:hypothetical protein
MSNGTNTNFQSVEQNFANYGKYAEFTRAKNWQGICEINGRSIDSFGTKKELNVLADHLEHDEIVFALASGIMSQTSTSNNTDWGTNTWLVALTNERFLFLDHAMFSKSVDTQSIRHDAVQAVSSSQGLILGKIQVDLGSRVVAIDNCQKADVKIIADLSNKWIKVLRTQTKSQAGNSSIEILSQMQENTALLRMQIKNQETIISLLEEIKNNTAT